MKKYLLVILLFASGILFASCSESLERADVDQAPECVNSFDVSLSEINRIDFSQMISPMTKSSGNLSKEITPIVVGADTLLYIINYENQSGWVIASGDKRSPLILAMGENDNFDISKIPAHPGINVWLERMKDEIKFLKDHPDYVPDSTYLRVWSAESEATKGGGGEHEGEWLQLVYTIVDYSDLHYNVDHFMSTHWGQEEPWNSCLPLDYEGSRCPAGCMIVAGAQTAYYLHNKIGKPTTAYQYGICNDYYNQSPSISLYNSSSSVWNTMALDSSSTSTSGKQAVAALMADVGKKANANWNPNGTQASLDGVRNYFSNYSVSCSAGSFDNETVLSEVLAEKPVIVALSSVNPSVIGDHTAVIDGILVYSERYTYYYQWMPMGTYPPVEPEYPDLDHPELYVIGQAWGDNTSYYYRLNWGFDDGYLDQGYFLFGTQWGIASMRYTPDAILYNFH